MQVNSFAYNFQTTLRAHVNNAENLVSVVYSAADLYSFTVHRIGVFLIDNIFSKRGRGLD